MNKTPSGRLPFHETFGRILMLLIASVWWFRFELPAGESLFFSPVVDGLVILILTFISWRRGLAWQDGLVWLILSRRIHIDAYNNLEALQAIVQVSWAIWGFAWTAASTPRAWYLLILYHGGLTFDAGMAGSFGLGMTVGWEAAPLTLMFLSAAVRGAVKQGGETRFPAGAVPVFIGLLFLAVFHRNGPAAHLTCAVTATAAAMILFFATSPADTEQKGGEAAVLALAGIPLCLAAIQLGVADAPGLDIFLRKRLFAGGLHPNLIGAWSLLMLVIAGSRASWEILPPAIRRVVHATAVMVYGTMIFCAGSRVVLLTGLLIGLAALAAGWRGSKESRGLISLGLVSVLALAVWRIGQSTTLAELLLNERVFIWRAAWQNIRNALWTGHGVLAYGELPQVIDPDAGVWVFDWMYPHTHQLFLEILLWGGLPLLMCLAVAVVLWLRRVSGGSPLYAALAVALIGCADFVYFTPAMVLVLLSVWFHQAFSRRGGGAEIRPRWRYPVLLLGAVALLGTVDGATAKSAFQRALGAIARGDGSWQQSLDAAVAASPARLDLRLQRMLMKLSFGMTPDEKSLAEAQALRTARPAYYITWFIEGRILELTGSHPAALEAYLKSLELEPRDPMGIRWARSALLARRLGRDSTMFAWRAIQRGSWGAACILDHPTFANEFRRALVTKLSGFHVTDVLEMLQAHLVSAALAGHGEGAISLPRLPGMENVVPDWLNDGWQSVEIMIASNTWGVRSALASSSSGVDRYLVSRLYVVGRMAESLGMYDLLGLITARLRSVWNYRNKNDESFLLEWWSARIALAQGRPAQALASIRRLNVMDPANPWILELLAQACEGLGDRQEACDACEAALRVVPLARRDPFFASGPRELYSPAGDQWSYAFERAFRRFDDEAQLYHAVAWDQLIDRLKQTSLRLKNGH